MARSLRIALSGIPAEGLTDFETGEDPAVWDADALNLEFWLGKYCGADEPYDVTDVSSLELEIRASQESSALLLPAISVDGGDLDECTTADWKSGESQHGTIEFEDGDLNFSSDVDKVWLSFRAVLASGGHRTFGAGYVKVIHSGHTGTASSGEIAEWTFSDGYVLFTLDGTTYGFIPFVGGSGSAPGTITVLDGAEFTIDSVNYRVPCIEGGSGSAEGTITIVDGYAEFTSDGTNYKLPLIEQ